MLHHLQRLSGARSTSIYLVSNMIAAAVPFILLPILVRLISPEEFGQIALFQGLFQIALALVGINTVGAVKRRYFDKRESGGEEDYAAYIGTNLVLLLVTALLGLGLMALLSGWLQDLTGFGFGILALAVGFAATRYITDLRFADYQMRKQAGAYGRMQILLAVTNAALSLALVVYVWRSAEGRIAGMAIAFALFALWSLWSLYRAGRISFSLNKERFHDALAYGAPLIPHTVGMFLLGSVDRFFVAEYAGLAMAGIYAAGMQLVFALRVVNDSINKSFQPWAFERLSRKTPADDRQVVVGMYRLFLLTIGFGAILAVAAPLLVGIVLGPRYEAAVEFLPILVLGTVFHGIYLFALNPLLYSGKTGHLSYTTVVVGAIGVLLLFVLTPAYGAVGAAWAFAIATLLRMLAITFLSRKFAGIDWPFPSIGLLVGRRN
ncbi:lipopolysaccharide biosynthesis protein [Aurantiacibacter sp. D1-12]|uniref:lipopolysaccharide biosynthesis protein n=1 Tax=Aurantiacibacter sp. D1-12 TaxID=2993658 RepID=UPI00237C7F83|nr:oligosaccharide flippase family protein [Aurantiacibacter sp. D1-12]MDE1466896.1 oligosaccharide flippase family protein [Aurantiacibacter sp. D1-12]